LQHIEIRLKEHEVKYINFNYCCIFLAGRTDTPILIAYDTPIERIQNLYKEKKGNKIKFTVEKTIQGKRHRKRFDEINDAIDYLNELNKTTF